jgi:hypothetical protein
VIKCLPSKLKTWVPSPVYPSPPKKKQNEGKMKRCKDVSEEYVGGSVHAFLPALLALSPLVLPVSPLNPLLLFSSWLRMT